MNSIFETGQSFWKPLHPKLIPDGKGMMGSMAPGEEIFRVQTCTGYGGLFGAERCGGRAESPLHHLCRILLRQYSAGVVATLEPSRVRGLDRKLPLAPLAD